MPPSVTRRVVAISGLHRGESPQPGGAVIESLRARFPDIRIIGLSYDPLESGIYSAGGDRLDAAYLMPYPGIGPDALRERLIDIAGREGVNCVIPCLDSELSNYLAIAPALAAAGIRCRLPSREAIETRGKARLVELCRRTGIPALKTFQADDPHSLAAYADRVGFPCYVKGKLYDALAVGSVSEIHNAFHEIHRIWGGPVLLQEAVCGEEYDIAGIGDGKGGIVAFCTVRKMLRSRLGKGYAGIVVENEILAGFARRIIGALQWDGPFELEFIKAPGRDPVLMEMNPRFPAWIDFPTKLGCNMPAFFLQRIYGEAPDALAACGPGKMFIRHCTDLVGDLADMAHLLDDKGGNVMHASPRNGMPE